MSIGHIKINSIIEYILALLLVICCNSMVFRSTMIFPKGGFSEYYLFISIFLVVLFYLVVNNPIRLNHKLRIIIFSWILYCVLIFIIQIVIGSMDIAVQSLFRFSLVFCSLLVFEAVNASKGAQHILLEKIVKLVTILALISFVLWILGSLLDILPYSYVSTDWSSGEIGLFLPVKSYFNLMFESQGTVTIFGMQLIRNCGIFTESPMYGFVLVIALLLNEFYLEHNNKFASIILLMTIFSTTSYTSIACAIVVLIMKMIVFQKKINNNVLKFLWLLLILACLFLDALILQSLIIEKAATNIISTNRRSSDIEICLNTFFKTIVGCGFYNQVEYTSNLSGSTSGFFRLLGEMGILLGWLPIYFAIGTIRINKSVVKGIFFILGFFVMYIFTNLPYTPLILLLFAIPFTTQKSKNIKEKAYENTNNFGSRI